MIDNVDARIAAIMAKKAGAVGPDNVQQGTEVQPTRSHAGPGQINVTVPSSLSAADERASRSAKTMHGPKVLELRMPDTSLLPRNDGTAVALGDLLLFPSNGGGWGEKDKVSACLPDGRVEREPEAVLRLIYEAVRAGNKPTLA